MTDKKKRKLKGVRQGDEFETYNVGTCENCLKEKVKVRKVEAFSMFARASRETSRGFYNLCFECYGPQVTFRSRGQKFHAPTNIIETPEGLEYFVVCDE